MLSFLPAPLLGILVLLLIVLNTLFWCTALIPLVGLKLMPLHRLRHFSNLALIRCAEQWVASNSAILYLTQKTHWDVKGLEELDLQHSYLVISNHRSWTDIFVLQHIFHNKIPFLKFFLKQELIWFPLLGLAWWALDFPFMKRYSREFLEKHPELRGKDLETTRQHCEKFKKYPVSVINFLEGTRFKAAKQRLQNAPYRHLLRPKAGGVALVLSAMGDTLKQVLDVTVLYPNVPVKNLFWALLSGRIPEIVVRVRALPLPEQVTGRDYQADASYQTQIQTWVNQLWEEKDALIESLLQSRQTDLNIRSGNSESLPHAA